MTRRRSLHWVLLAACLLAFTESTAWVGYRLHRGSWFSWSAFQNVRATIRATEASAVDHDRALAGEPTVGARAGRHVLHPYLGFVMDPRSREGVSELGFRSNPAEVPVTETAPDRVMVGVFGGSVAAATSIRARGTLREGIVSIPRFHNRSVVIHTVAWAGYKQPQQLMALAYLLSLGAQFDLVVNLDGFNEVALPAVDNLPAGVFPFYPRNWFGDVHGLTDRRALGALARVESLSERRRGWAAVFSGPFLEWSVVGNLVWELGDGRLGRRLSEEEAALRRRGVDEGSDRPYVVTGPRFEITSDDELYRSLARVWARSSLQMAQLCTANGAEYFHFLQPNQYLTGSKPMGRAERTLAVVADQPYRPGVEHGYPVLLQEASFLRSNAVRFHDLTQVFASTEEPTYSDACCHLNQHGYDMLGAAIVSAIQSHLGVSSGG